MEDENLDDLEQLMDGLHFDIDGFLELEQFEFDEVCCIVLDEKFILSVVYFINFNSIIFVTI